MSQSERVAETSYTTYAKVKTMVGYMVELEAAVAKCQNAHRQNGTKGTRERETGGASELDGREEKETLLQHSVLFLHPLPRH